MEVDKIRRLDNNRYIVTRKMSQDELSISVPEPRENLIQSAVSFLTDQKVSKALQSEKENFLRSKGLTAEEIKLAFDRCSPFFKNAPASGQMMHYPIQPPLLVPPLTGFQKFREILHTIALITGVTYGLYYFIKKFIWQFLFGKPKKPDGVEGAVTELNKVVQDSIGELRSQVEKVHSDLEKVIVVQGEQQLAVRNLGDIKSEVATVKGILLSRNQFPTVNMTGSTSIPAWQMAVCNDSGDRSSEAEVVLRNSNNGSQGSDSSLEMIKEVEAAEAES